MRMLVHAVLPGFIMRLKSFPLRNVSWWREEKMEKYNKNIHKAKMLKFINKQLLETKKNVTLFSEFRG
jgi:hypothetical protein